MNRYVILGTAGHIDHGKSSLVKALTGTDPDRLKEEKERGITIDLGFADLAYPDGLKVGIVDVPGHERLIKNMLAGAGGIDIVLMVIAADEGIMPQSREHLDICNLLRVKQGIIAVTKSDLVEQDWIDLVAEEVREFVRGTFLEGANIVPVSSKTGDGIDLLRETIHERALHVSPKSVKGIFRLPVDRIFTMKGFGTVVTGTAIAGSISIESPIVILPKGIRTKVRGLQSHGETMKSACAGQRVAMNLQGVAKEDIRRGDVITIPDKVTVSRVVDAEIEMLGGDDMTPLKSRSLVHFHTGTAEMTGRVVLYESDALKPGTRGYGQFRFKEPLAVMAGDRFIIRRFSPLVTIGGGTILDTSPRRRKKEEKRDELTLLDSGTLQQRLLVKILHSGLSGMTQADIERWINVEVPEIQRTIEALLRDGAVIRCEGCLISREVFDAFAGKAMAELGAFHKSNPLKQGMPKESLKALFDTLEPRLFDALLKLVKEIVVERDHLRLQTFAISLSDDKKAVKERILKVLEQSEFQPSSRDELARSVSIKPQEAGELLRIMTSEHSLVRINDSLYIPKSRFDVMMDRLSTFFSTKKEMTVGEFRDMLGTSRKFALPFLEYLDSNKITLRVGEIRKFLAKRS